MLVEDDSQANTRFGLRAKFVSLFVVITLIVAAVIVGGEQLQVRRTLVSETVVQGNSIADAIESTAGYYVLFGLTDDLKKILSDLKAKNRSIDYADFVTVDGKLLAASDPNTPAVVTTTSTPSSAVQTGKGQTGHLFVRSFSESGKVKGYFRMLMNEQEARRAATSLLWASFFVTLLALGIATAIGLGSSRFFVRPILNLADSAQRIAQGDLTHRSNVATDDEIGVLADAFNLMAGNLEKTVTKLVRAQAQLKSVADTVGSRSRTVIERVDEQRAVIDETYHSIDKLNTGVRKITDNVEALSASSEETSSSMLEMVASMEEVTRHTESLFSSVEDTSSATHEMVTSINEVDQNVVYLTNFVTDTSSSMVEMSASIAQVEANAARSYDLALAVADAAESGMSAVRETIDGMEQIRRSVAESNSVVSRLGERSVAIGKILNVIEDVAEQTNLLALNAAILAAQAGEHGKGFSVVAAEIRELSERTASSAREIGTLIRSVQQEVGNALKTMAAGSKLVEDGVSLSHQAGKALNNILESSSKASGMGREIAGATREQAQGSEQVTRSVERLQEMSKQINSATTQQAQGSDHILKAVETMREVTKYVRQAMVEQKSGSTMISSAAERMIDMIHEIFQVAANQASESEKIVATMEQVRSIADNNRASANEMSQSIALLNDALRTLDEEVRSFRVRA
jgi:methyl-accepting chemotaxis protein